MLVTSIFSFYRNVFKSRLKSRVCVVKRYPFESSLKFPLIFNIAKIAFGMKAER